MILRQIMSFRRIWQWLFIISEATDKHNITSRRQDWVRNSRACSWNPMGQTAAFVVYTSWMPNDDSIIVSGLHFLILSILVWYSSFIFPFISFHLHNDWVIPTLLYFIRITAWIFSLDVPACFDISIQAENFALFWGLKNPHCTFTVAFYGLLFYCILLSSNFAWCFFVFKSLWIASVNEGAKQTKLACLLLLFCLYYNRK